MKGIDIMFTITKEISLLDHNAWSGAISRMEQIEELDIVDEATQYILDCLGDEFSETELNDFIWFEMDEFIEHYETEES